MNTKEYEVIILGTGPAGLQAAIHGARSKVSVLVLGKREQSSIYRAHIENYCCLPNISGDELLQQGIEQARRFGADFIEEDVLATSMKDDLISVTSERGTVYNARSLIFTIGITRNNLNVPGENTLRGYGVSYCVDCDANFYKNRPVAITGNGSAAVHGALTLTSYTDTVHLISEKINVDELLERQLRESAVKTHEGRKIKEIRGDNAVQSVLLDNNVSLAVDGVFIELGAKGAMELAGFLGIQMDENFRHIEVNRKQETSVPGIYAAGDICGPPWQIAKAVGEGCVAGLEAARYAKKFR
ncbi:MAG TPA: NAD(P)/FAD-dependent oxidoreductase [Spirochaetota bacterium]|nr:NAD(P)/FAD-dependent oxidoreductase [Spirochaetota bacterium]